MHRGYVKLWRKSLESPIWKNQDVWRVWSWCLLKATHAEFAELVGYQCVPLKPGQFVFGRKIAARETGLSEQTIRTALALLQKLGNLTIESTNKFSILTIEKWEDYQSINQQVTSTPTKKQPAANHIQAHQAQEEHKDIESPDGDSSGSAHAAPSARTQKRPPCPYSEILALYHELLPQLPTVQSFDDSAKKTMRARWSESPERQDLKFWRRVFITVAASDFLMGRVKDWQCPGLLWIIGPKNFAKIVNGHYSNHGPRTGSSLTDSNLRIAQEWAAEGGAPQ